MQRFYYTTRQLLKNAKILLHNATVIKIAKILLHNGTVIEKDEGFVTQCGSY